MVCGTAAPGAMRFGFRRRGSLPDTRQRTCAAWSRISRTGKPREGIRSLAVEIEYRFGETLDHTLIECRHTHALVLREGNEECVVDGVVILDGQRQAASPQVFTGDDAAGQPLGVLHQARRDRGLDPMMAYPLP